MVCSAYLSCSSQPEAENRGLEAKDPEVTAVTDSKGMSSSLGLRTHVCINTKAGGQEKIGRLLFPLKTKFAFAGSTPQMEVLHSPGDSLPKDLVFPPARHWLDEIVSKCTALLIIITVVPLRNSSSALAPPH